VRREYIGTSGPVDPEDYGAYVAEGMKPGF
jgi:hypothetical protein